MTADTKTGRFELGDLVVESGALLKGATLSWKSYGALSPARDNAIVFPTSYSAQHMDQEWLIGPDGILDPSRWFIVIPDMFGNGLSSSPSTTEDYPGLVTTADNVRAQRRLLTEVFGIETVACVYGFSMGAQQAYHWAALFPQAVRAAIAVCGTARTSVHNRVFLHALQATLEAAPEHLGGGRFSRQPDAAMRAFARIYATMALSQDWYRENLHLQASCAARPRTSTPNAPHGWHRTSARMPSTAATSCAPFRRSRRVSSSCPRAPTSISQSPTTPRSFPTCGTPSCVRFPASGAAGRATLRRTRPTRHSCATPSPTGWRADEGGPSPPATCFRPNRTLLAPPTDRTPR